LEAELEAAASELEGLGFSREEAERLARYREWAGRHGEHAERLRFERRLDFVRWLLEHDKIQH
jgi:hypothetical protein